MKFIFLLLVLFSCNHSSNWQVERLYSDCEEHCSNKLSYLTKDYMSGINLEILYIRGHIKAYLHLYPHAIKQSTVVELITKEATQSFNAYCLTGGQKILLPQECLNFLLHALENEQTVQITIGGYQSIIEPMGFQENFKKLQTFSPLVNPFQFSF
ncbi:MAG: hypothetical protein ACRDDW_00420 [Candidatus Rhabdochlamydia sp.]